ERDDGETATGRQHLLGRGQAALQLAELVVHGDAQRLESARGRIALVPALRANGAAHDLGELARALDGLLLARLDDGARYAPALPLFTVAPDDVGELGLVAFVDDVGGGAAGALHAHVERPGGAEGKAAFGIVELHGGDAEIERHAIDFSDAL